MSARKPAQRLQFECSSSRKLRLLFSSAVFLSLLCVTALPLPLSSRFFLILLIITLAGRCWRRRCELGASAVTLSWDADSRWWWSQGSSYGW